MQWSDGQAGGWSWGPGNGQLLLCVFRSRWRREDGNNRTAAQPAQLHHSQRPYRSVMGLGWETGKLFCVLTEFCVVVALSNTVATVCSPAEVSCLDSYSFPPLDSLHRSSLSHDESLGFPTNGGDPGCLNMLDAGFYHSDLGQLGGVCVTKECERPSKRLKMALPDSFISDVSVGNLGVDFEARRTTHHHRITGAKMAVSLTDFASLAGSGEPNGFLGAHTRHHTQHTAALQSEWSSSFPLCSSLLKLFSCLYIRLTSLETPICLKSI